MQIGTERSSQSLVLETTPCLPVWDQLGCVFLYLYIQLNNLDSYAIALVGLFFFVLIHYIDNNTAGSSVNTKVVTDLPS